MMRWVGFHDMPRLVISQESSQLLETPSVIEGVARKEQLWRKFLELLLPTLSPHLLIPSDEPTLQFSEIEAVLVRSHDSVPNFFNRERLLGQSVGCGVQHTEPELHTSSSVSIQDDTVLFGPVCPATVKHNFEILTASHENAPLDLEGRRSHKAFGPCIVTGAFDLPDRWVELVNADSEVTCV
jgi:hypothetical protein